MSSFAKTPLSCKHGINLISAHKRGTNLIANRHLYKWILTRRKKINVKYFGAFRFLNLNILVLCLKESVLVFKAQTPVLCVAQIHLLACICKLIMVTRVQQQFYLLTIFLLPK